MMKKIQTFFHKRKRAIALFLAGATAAVSCLTISVRAFNLTNDLWWYEDDRAICTWGEDSVAMQWNNDKWKGLYIPTGLAFNSAGYISNPAAIPPEMLGNYDPNTLYWPLGAQMFVVARPGYENEDFAMFHGRHTYCSGNHERAAGIQPGAQVFVKKEKDEKEEYFIGYNLPNHIYDDASTGKVNPEFNFLMLVLACYYPGDYSVPKDSEVSNHDPWVAYGMVSQIITWMATDSWREGFKGPPKGADSAAVDAAFFQDLAYFRESDCYKKLEPITMAMHLDPEIHRILFETEVPANLAAAGLTSNVDVIFWEIWNAAYFTSLLQPDWDKEITKANSVMEMKDGEYHVYVDLFVNDSAKLYLDGVSFHPYGDWEDQGIDSETGKRHFKSVSGELDENESIGKLYWPKGKLGSFMPLDMTKAKIYAFDTYNANATPHLDLVHITLKFLRISFFELFLE